MISRLERLVGLSYEQLRAIPNEEQVTWRELQEWKSETTQRVHDVFSGKADSQLELSYKLWEDEVDRGEGSEVGRILTYCRHVVSILQGLEGILFQLWYARYHGSAGRSRYRYPPGY